ncbi:MAG: cadherin-like domain-containing protein [Verrucomicrobiota bacterium]
MRKWAFIPTAITLCNLQATPTPVNDSINATEDAPINIAVLEDNGGGADSESSGRALTVVSVTNPTSGTTVIQADNTVTYTPDLNFAGSDSFDYTIEDPDGASASATVTISVANTPDRPIVTAAILTPEEIFEDSTGNMIQFTAFDPDPDDEIVGYRVAYTSTNFNMLETDGSLVPRDTFFDLEDDMIQIDLINENFTGDVIFSYAAVSEEGATVVGDHLSVDAFLIIPVVPVNDPPVANTSSATLDEANAILPGVSTLNVSDVDRETISTGRLVSIPAELEVREIDDPFDTPGDLVAEGETFSGLSLHFTYVGPDLDYGDGQNLSRFEVEYIVSDSAGAESNIAKILVSVEPTFESVSTDGVELNFTFVQDTTSATPAYEFVVTGMPPITGLMDFGDSTSEGLLEHCIAWFSGTCFTGSYQAPGATIPIPIDPNSDTESMAFRYTPTDPDFVGSDSFTFGLRRISQEPINNTDATITITIVPPPTPAEVAFQAWVDSFGLTGEDATVDGNPAFDGIDNLLKFSSNLNPLASSSPDDLATTEVILVADIPTIRYSFLRRRDGLVAYTPQYSTTLAIDGWTDFTSAPSVTPIDAGWETVTYGIPLLGIDTDRRFVRLQVVLATPSQSRQSPE